MIYLYIKTHNTTGLKYFGKTTKTDYHKYKGSGTYWLKHIKKHGYDVTTELVGVFNTDDVRDYAVKFSIDNNIVESKEWANLEIETGLDGRGPVYSGEFIINICKKYKNKKDIESDYPGILHCAKNLDILEVVTEHMIHSGIKWTISTILEEAKKYSKKSEFASRASGCASAARSLNIWEEATKHMIAKRTPKYNIEEALEEAKKYTSKYKYSVESKMGNWLREIGLWEEATKHMVNPVKIYHIIDESSIVEKSKECVSKTDFSIKHPTYYKKARELNILNNLDFRNNIL